MTEPTTKRTAEDVLRDLAMYLGVGGYNDIGDAPFDPEKFDRKIRWGIDYFVKATVTRCADKVEELSKRPSTRWGEVKAAIQAIAPEPEALAKPVSEAEPVARYLAGLFGEAVQPRHRQWAAEVIALAKPASSPAGGDVVARLLWNRWHARHGGDYDGAEGTQARADTDSLAKQIIASLSQSTSAGSCDGIREFPHDLVERVESGTGKDRELDCLIEAALDGRSISESGNMILARNSRPPHDTYILGWIDPGKTSRNFSEGPSRPPVPRYTDSLDAVVDLLVRRLPAVTDNSAADFLAASIDEMMVRGWRPSEPNIPQICRAVLAAFLRALQEARILADAHSKNPPEAEHG